LTSKIDLHKIKVSMFVYQLTKNVFYDEMISIIRSIYVKIFSAQKTPKGFAFKIFWVHPKKKKFIYQKL